MVLVTATYQEVVHLTLVVVVVVNEILMLAEQVVQEL
jgi:hypothetical protein